MDNLLTPLKPPYPPAARELLRAYPSRDGRYLQLFEVFAHSPRHLAKFSAAGMLDGDSPLTMAEREAIILRVTARYRCEYEWGVHVKAYSRATGFSDAQVADTLAARPDPALWPSALALLMEACDALCQAGRLEPALRRQLEHRWEAVAQLEIFALVGFYHTISNVANTAHMELEPWAARFADYA